MAGHIALAHPRGAAFGELGFIRRDAMAEHQPVHERELAADGDGVMQCVFVPAGGEHGVGVGLVMRAGVMRAGVSVSFFR